MSKEGHSEDREKGQYQQVKGQKYHKNKGLKKSEATWGPLTYATSILIAEKPV